MSGHSSLANRRMLTYRELGDRQATAIALVALANAVRGQGNVPHAKAHYGEALDLFRGLDHKPGMASALTHLVGVALDEEIVGVAMPLLAEGLTILRLAGDTLTIDATLDMAARVAETRERWNRAAQLVGATSALRAAIDAPVAPGDDHAGMVATLRAALGEDGIAAMHVAGRALSLDQAVALAQALAG